MVEDGALACSADQSQTSLHLVSWTNCIDRQCPEAILSAMSDENPLHWRVDLIDATHEETDMGVSGETPMTMVDIEEFWSLEVHVAG